MAVQPQQAVVAPHAISKATGQSLLLTDLIQMYVDSDTLTVRVIGHGKTTALSHIAAEFDPFEVVVLDDIDRRELFPLSQFDKARLVVVTCRFNYQFDQVVELSPWSQDDVIEYVVGKFPDRCKSVMSRLTNANDSWLANGTPAIWSVVLNSMAETESIQNVRQALSLFYSEKLANPKMASRAKELCARFFDVPGKARYEFARQFPKADKQLLHVLAQRNFCCLLASEHLATEIREGQSLDFLGKKLPKSLLNLLGERVKTDKVAQDVLEKIANRHNDVKTAAAISMLVSVDRSWRPKSGRSLLLNHCQLAGVDWAGVKLNRCEGLQTDFANANLRKAKIRSTTFMSADFSNVDMRDAVLVKVNALSSNFSNANLQNTRFRKFSGAHSNFDEANMQGMQNPHAKFLEGSFRGANLTNGDFFASEFQQADFEDAKLNDADFSQANLENARLTNADASNCNFRSADLCFAQLHSANLQNTRFSQAKLQHASLVGQVLDGNDFREANLSRAFLTNSRMRNVNLKFAKLAGARLAEIDWEDCNLQDADFTGCQFHLGSTRCGLVGSYYPSHGTRTGFYTEEYDEQYFKYPEEIRKANLCHCDLTGADVLKADFYLVDLRGAIYTDEQHQHFQRCKAIL